jgi:hypothetical protein
MEADLGEWSLLFVGMENRVLDLPCQDFRMGEVVRHLFVGLESREFLEL